MSFPGIGHWLRDEYAGQQSARRGPGWPVRYLIDEGTRTVIVLDISHRSGTYGTDRQRRAQHSQPAPGHRIRKPLLHQAFAQLAPKQMGCAPAEIFPGGC